MKTKTVKKTLPRVAVSSGSVEAFARRSLERARKLDRGGKLAPEITHNVRGPRRSDPGAFRRASTSDPCRSREA